jgi:hypothetical protein
MDPITMEELKKTIEDIPNKKSPGPSKIPNEVWKNAPTSLLQILLNLLNQCLEQADTPQVWKEAIIILIPKKDQWEGDLTNTRPITLLETTQKILTKILTN